MTPRVSGDGSMLAWISWDHPNMGWDATRLHVHRLGDGELGEELMVLGRQGDRQSVRAGLGSRTAGSAPRLMVCSDHDDWWGLYEVDLGAGDLMPVVVGEFDVATPPWVFGMQRWAAADGMVAAAAGMPWGDQMVVDGRNVAVADSSISSLTIGRDGPDGAPVLAYAGAGYRHETEVAALSIDSGGHPERGAVRRPATWASIWAAGRARGHHLPDRPRRRRGGPRPCTTRPPIRPVPARPVSGRRCSSWPTEVRPAQPAASSSWASPTGRRGGSRSSMSTTGAPPDTAAATAEPSTEPGESQTSRTAWPRPASWPTAATWTPTG